MTRATKLALAVALLLPFSFIWQGLDFTDEGYALTIYRCFFRHPRSIDTAAHLWLTDFVGAGWDAALGGFGVVSERALWATCLSLVLLMVFAAVRNVTSAEAAALGVLATSACLVDRRETWFSYNTLTSVLEIGAAVCFQHGIVKRRASWLFAGGALVGMSPFARFPNVLSVALCSASVLAAVLEQPRRARLSAELGMTALGCACGAGGVLATICTLGHWQQYHSAVLSLFAPQAAATGYGAHELIARFIRDESSALAAGLAVCVGAALLVWLASRVGPRARVLLFSAAAVLGLLVLTHGRETWRWFLPGTGYFVLGALVLGHSRRSVELRVSAWLALIVLVIAPLGSDNGILNAHVGLWFALPLTIAGLYTHETPAGTLWGQGRALAVLAACMIGVEGVHQAWTYTYRDRPRPQLTSRVDDPQLRGQLTSAARAQAVAEVLHALRPRVAPGDYLLAFEGTPMLQYLTSTLPYLDRAWLMDAEPPEVVARLLAQAPGSKGCLAVAVRTRGSARTHEWPDDVRHGLEQNEPIKSARRLIWRFLRAHRYRVTWSNAFFEILEPPAAPEAAARHCR